MADNGAPKKEEPVVVEKVVELLVEVPRPFNSTTFLSGVAETLKNGGMDTASQSRALAEITQLLASHLGE